MSHSPLTLGTAGHIDHGKTALIGALTGRDTDRLPEEHRRGISIELGYAQLVLPSGRSLSVIDVPGHERFVRTMVAGATGIDLFLLCVAADDGVMPQTHEHLVVLRRLGIERGVVAVTKADAADPSAALEQVRELLPDSDAVAVSVRSREGLDELLAALDRVAATLPGRARDGGAARLHVDRSFTLKGIGTVVTGTLWSGELAVGDTVEVLPGGLSARVRSVQVHDRQVECAQAGQRVAVNLAGLDRREIARGDVVCGRGADLEPRYLLDGVVWLEQGARALERGARVHVHHGTREAPARVVPLGADEITSGARGYAQLRLESPLMAARGDRFVVRQLAPPDTVGGGVVLDAAPRKHGPATEVVERLAALERGEAPPACAPDETGDEAERPEPQPALGETERRLEELLRAGGRQPPADGDLAAQAGIAAGDARRALAALVQAGRAVRVAQNLHYDAGVLAELEREVVALGERDRKLTIAGVRDALGTSRRYAQALLEHLDAEKVTIRRGDEHHLRRGARQGS